MRKSSNKHEIERRFLVKTLPGNIHISSLPRKEIVQSYLIVTDHKEELRIRQEGDSYFLTLKYGEGLVRAQPEIQLTKEQFDTLWDSEGSRKVWKTRYFVHIGDMEVHLDVYKGKLDGLVTAEVEFRSKKEAMRFHLPPSWNEKMQEITGFPAYKNSALALVDEYVGPKVAVQSELERGFDKLMKEVNAKRSESRGSIVVGIAGGSASGKTSMVSTKLKEKLGDDAVRISIDDYYKGSRFIKEFGLNFDQPEAVDLDLFAEHLNALKAGNTIQKPVYDFKTGTRTEQTETVSPRRVIIVEGLFALNERIRRKIDIGVFVDVGSHGRVIRRLKSDSERTDLTPFQTLSDITRIVEPMYLKHVLPTKAHADIVIKNEYDPWREAKSTGISQSQVKYEIVRSDVQEMLRKAGGISVARVKQVDRYFTPTAGTFADSDEILRIREEGGRRVFTYKGPRSESDEAIKRQVFSFEIDDETNDMLSRMYQMQPTVVIKDRTVYYFNGMLLTIDDVATGKREGTATSVAHQSYLEFTIQNEKGAVEKMSQLAEKIGLDQSKRILKPYWEILA